VVGLYVSSKSKKWCGKTLSDSLPALQHFRFEDRVTATAAAAALADGMLVDSSEVVLSTAKSSQCGCIVDEDRVGVIGLGATPHSDGKCWNGDGRYSHSRYPVVRGTVVGGDGDVTDAANAYQPGRYPLGSLLDHPRRGIFRWCRGDPPL
jgi:hypothetical protein